MYAGKDKNARVHKLWPCGARRAESDLAGGGLTEGGFLYNAMNDFLEAIQQVILVLKFFQAPQQYDDFPKTLFDQVAP